MQYIGQPISNTIKSHKDRYFYGLRRTDDGELYLAKVDQMTPGDSVTINNPGLAANNYDDWNEGQDFFDGRDVNHDKIYANLKYEQYKWDDINLYYYINAEGELVVRINHPIDMENPGAAANAYTYPNVSEIPLFTGASIKWDQDTVTFDNNEATWDRT
jgi:hypothetical protein